MSACHIHRFGPAHGPLVLALHGLTGHGGRWATLAAEHLPEARVVAPDLRGHGRSTSLPPWTFETVVDDVADALDGETAVVVGHSFGGAVGIHLARTHPELVRALVLLDPAIGLDPAFLLEVSEGMFTTPGYADREAARLDKLETGWGDVDPRLLADELDEHLVPLATGGLGWRMSVPAIVSYWGQLARPVVLPPADLPTTLVWARKAPFVTERLRETLAGHLGDRLTVHEFDSDHMVAQALPAETAAVIRAVL